MKKKLAFKQQALGRKREHLLNHLLSSIDRAAEGWAMECSNGGLVWQVCVELNHAWEDWRFALSQPRWEIPERVVRSIEYVANLTRDRNVLAMVNRAKQELANYKD